jgi:hypothetical protein
MSLDARKDYLMQCIHELRLAHERAIKPYIDELVRLRSMGAPSRLVYGFDIGRLDQTAHVMSRIEGGDIRIERIDIREPEVMPR